MPTTRARLTTAALAALTAAGGVVAVEVAAAPTASAADPAPVSTLRAGQYLVEYGVTKPNGFDEVRSPNGRFSLDLQVWGDEQSYGVSTAFGITQDNSRVPVSVWQYRRDKSHAVSGAASLNMQTDGNLVLYARPGVVLWSSHTTGSGNRLAMQDDGNLVVYSSANRPLWSTGTHTVALHQGETLRPGEYLKSTRRAGRPATTVTMRTDGDLVISEGAAVVWASNTTTPGASATLQNDGNLVISARGRPLWASGTGGLVRGSDDGVVWLEADYSVRANLVLNQGPGFHGGPSVTERWSATDRPGELGLLGNPPGRRILTSGTQYWPQGSVLRAGQFLASTNGYRFTMQSDGNLVERAPDGRVLWASGTGGRPGAYLSVQNDGNLVVYGNGRALWNARSGGGGYSELVANVFLGTDGNVVARSMSGTVRWSTGPDRH